MLRDVPNSDWKIFRQLREQTLDRYCRRVLDEIAEVSADDKASNHERYLKICELIHERNVTMADAFNDPRRSMMLIQLKLMCELGLVQPAELAQFSDDTRRTVQAWLEVAG